MKGLALLPLIQVFLVNMVRSESSPGVASGSGGTAGRMGFGDHGSSGNPNNFLNSASTGFGMGSELENYDPLLGGDASSDDIDHSQKLGEDNNYTRSGLRSASPGGSPSDSGRPSSMVFGTGLGSGYPPFFATSGSAGFGHTPTKRKSHAAGDRESASPKSGANSGRENIADGAGDPESAPANTRSTQIHANDGRFWNTDPMGGFRTGVFGFGGFGTTGGSKHGGTRHLRGSYHEETLEAPQVLEEIPCE